MTHPGKEALERASGWISGPHKSGVKYTLSYEANADDLRDILAYVEELEHAVESAMGHANRFHEALEATRDCRNAALEEAARLSATLPYHTGLGVAVAIRELKDKSDG